MRLSFVRHALLVGILSTLTLTGWAQSVGRTAAPVMEAPSVRVLVLPNGETVIASPIAGRITEIHTAMGRPFRRGAVLVSLDCGEHQARAAMAQADLASATESHEAKLRMQGLDQASDVEVALAASAVAKAKAQIDLIQFQIEQCTIRAPWDGQTSTIHARSHMAVTPGQPLMDLVRRGVLLLKLNVPSRWTTQIKAGHEFEVVIDETGKSYTAKVQRINSRVDPVSQTIELEAAMQQIHPELLPGMSGNARFPGMR
jgi:membrane fusion protein (multidrug efflux system)